MLLPTERWGLVIVVSAAHERRVQPPHQKEYMRRSLLLQKHTALDSHGSKDITASGNRVQEE
jgi:hypothetical protein